MKTICLLFLLAIPRDMPAQSAEFAQQKTFGDRAVGDAILARTREFYGKETARVYLLIADNALRLPGSHGTELDGELVGSDLVRVVAKVPTNRGNYAAEFYFREGEVLFVYETFEYFSGTAPVDAWQNFRHIAAWERRSFFRAGVVVYSSSHGTGAPEPGSGGKQLQERARRVAALLANRPQVPTSH